MSKVFSFASSLITSAYSKNFSCDNVGAITDPPTEITTFISVSVLKKDYKSIPVCVEITHFLAFNQ